MKSLSLVQLFTTPRTAAYQALPRMGFSRQEYWSGVPLPWTFNCCLFRPSRIDWTWIRHHAECQGMRGRRKEVWGKSKILKAESTKLSPLSGCATTGRTLSNWVFQVLVVPVPYTVKKQSMEVGRKGETEGRVEGDSEEGREKRNRSNNIYNSSLLLVSVYFVRYSSVLYRHYII